LHPALRESCAGLVPLHAQQRPLPDGRGHPAQPQCRADRSLQRRQ
jgi:hypothetical protein